MKSGILQVGGDMMKNNLIYYIMTYIMYLYPPFIWFMVMVNFDTMSDQNQWIVGLVVNVIFVLITSSVLYLLAYLKKIPKIEQDEKAHFIFGYVGNVIVYLYVYQNLMNIERWYSVFTLVLILVIAYKYLISQKITFKEILLFSVIFGVIDYIIIIISGNTLLSDNIQHISDTQSMTFQIMVLGALIFTIGWYGFRLYKHHAWGLLRYILLGFIVITLIMFYGEAQEELIATLAIITVFTWLIDIILKLIHKTFKVYDLVFYARLIMVTVVLLMIKTMELYVFPNFELESMFLLIAIFYVTAFADIIMNMSPKTEQTLDLNLSIEAYIKQLYKPLTSRYKDVLVFTKKEDQMHDLSQFGRHIIMKSSLKNLDSLEINAISFVIVYVDMMYEIEHIKEKLSVLNICVISSRSLTHPLLKTSFTDFDEYVYTI